MFLVIAVVLMTAYLLVAGSPFPRSELIRPGTSGSFTFLSSANGSARTVTVWYDAPSEHLSEAEVLVVMTGRQRNGEEYRDEWAPYSRRYGVLLLVPELSEDMFPGDRYNIGNVVDESGDPVPEGEWAFSLIEPLFDAVVADTGNSSQGYNLYGHSAGAQFVHRFLLLNPDHRVERAVSANSGWYTAIEEETAFPYGLKGSPATKRSVKRALDVPLTILLGQDDDDSDADGLRNTAEAKAQGEHRLARGKFFYKSARDAALLLNVPFRWELVIVPDAAHENAAMAPAAARQLFE